MRNSKRILKRFLAAASAGLMAVGMLSLGGTQKNMEAVKAYGVTDSVGTVNYKTILGGAAEYGVVADTYIQEGHTETNVAVKTYQRSGDNNDVDLAGDAPIPFIIGKLAGSDHLKFGDTWLAPDATERSAMTYNILAGPGVYSDAYAATQGVEKSASAVSKLNIVWNKKDTTAEIDAYVDVLVNRIKTQSDALFAKKTADMTDATVVTNHDPNSYVIDVRGIDPAGNQVVYLDIPSGSDFYNAANTTNGVRIYKNSGTVVILNLGAADVNVKKYSVITEADTFVTSEHKYGGNTSGVNTTINDNFDEQVAQKVIWNMNAATNVTIEDAVGTFIIPSAANIESKNSGGWIATAGVIDSKGEWHFIHRKERTGVVNTDTERNIRFELRKAFTRNLNKMVVKEGENSLIEDTSVDVSEGDYSFDLYTTNADFLADTLVETKKNDATGWVYFSYMNYAAAGTHYYKIKEQAVDKDGISNPGGEIDIIVDVVNVGGKLDVRVSSWKYVSASDVGDTSKAYRHNNAVSVAETQPGFRLGPVFNKVASGNLEITVVDEDTQSPVSGAKVKVKDPSGTTTEYTTDASGKISIDDTLTGKHDIIVTEAPTGYRVTTGEVASANVEDGKTAKHQAEVTPTGGLKITVLDEETGSPVKDAIVRITDKKAKSTDYVTDANGQIQINPTDTGDYELVVTKVPAGKKVTVGEKKTVTVEKLKITEHVAKVNTVPTGNIEITVKDEVTDKPVPDANVDVTSPSGVTDTHTTDVNGKVTLTDVPAGDYTVEITKVPEGYNVTTGQKTTVTVKEKETVETVNTNTNTSTTSTSTPATPESTKTTPTTNTTSTSTKTTTDKSVQTGDAFNVKVPLALYIISLLGIITLMYSKKKYDLF